MSIDLVLGLGCSGKTTLAGQLGLPVIHLDSHKFLSPGWTRVTPAAFHDSVMKEIDEKGNVVIEGIYYDSGDRGATINLVDSLLSEGRVRSVLIFNPPASAMEQATRIMTRSFGRLLGRLPQNESGNDERPEDVARLMQKTFFTFDQSVAELAALNKRCIDLGVPVTMAASHPVSYQ